MKVASTAEECREERPLAGRPEQCSAVYPRTPRCDPDWAAGRMPQPVPLAASLQPGTEQAMSYLTECGQHGSLPEFAAEVPQDVNPYESPQRNEGGPRLYFGLPWRLACLIGGAFVVLVAVTWGVLWLERHNPTFTRWWVDWEVQRDTERINKAARQLVDRLEREGGSGRRRDPAGRGSGWEQAAPIFSQSRDVFSGQTAH